MTQNLLVLPWNTSRNREGKNVLTNTVVLLGVIAHITRGKVPEPGCIPNILNQEFEHSHLGEYS